MRKILVVASIAINGSLASADPCVLSQVSSQSLQLASLASDCEAATGYATILPSNTPTGTQKAAICSECTDLLVAFSHMTYLNCTVRIDDKDRTLGDIFNAFTTMCHSTSEADSIQPRPTPSVPAKRGLIEDSTAGRPFARLSRKLQEDSNGVGTPIVIAFAVVWLGISAVLAFRLSRQQTDSVEDGTQDNVLSPPMDEREDPYRRLSMTPSHGHKSTENKTKSRDKTAGTTNSADSTMRNDQPVDLGVWNDPAVLTIRISYDTVVFGPLLSRGGYGVVYKGTYRGNTVAIKQLLPERRKDAAQINAFLSEIKLMATMEHERIVRLIGVAWNSLSDACVVVEYMENGDLRSVLTRWDNGDDMRPRGFDADKLKIALHVAHALTYLHSLAPMVVHRDLKSKNILLNTTLDAKLTDFGVSRERAESTMTAGVGSFLWMAPEVMLGERYNEKADIFSFGVVLSELDTHQLPYSHAKQAGTDRAIPDAAVLQLVTLGRLTVSFSELAHPEITQLGRECIALDPTQRPNSAEVLHRILQVMRNAKSIGLLV